MKRTVRLKRTGGEQVNSMAAGFIWAGGRGGVGYGGGVCQRETDSRARKVQSHDSSISETVGET